MGKNNKRTKETNLTKLENKIAIEEKRLRKCQTYTWKFVR